MEVHWPQGMDGLRAQYVSLQERWGKVWKEGEEWGKTLEVVYPEMQKFQVSGVQLHGLFLQGVRLLMWHNSSPGHSR